MLLDQETLKFVFGMKLRGLRLDKGFSLKDLAKKTGLSPSYLNEIEKGKKSPKTEKILMLADALGEKYDDLVSLELKRDLHLVQSLLDKKFLTGVPFELFGVPAATVFELLAEKPKKMRALVGTILEIARAHNIHIDDFYFGLLRAYIDMHDNYFPSLEEAAKKAANEYKISWDSKPEVIKAGLLKALEKSQIEVIEQDLTEISPDLKELLYFSSAKNKKFHLSNKIELTEQIFILARELGFKKLQLKSRPQSSLVSNLDSFDQLFNHFSASYFASSLLIPEDEILRDMKELFAAPDWSEQSFERLLGKYTCAYESLFHRMTQILPKHFGLRHLFFLRYEYDLKYRKYEVVRELHLANPEGPYSVKGNEHYCSRWLIHRLTKQQLKDSSKTSIGAQRSIYPRSNNEFLILSVAFTRPHAPQTITSVCIGLLKDSHLDKKINWLSSPKIATQTVGDTCERCPSKDCLERAVPLDPQLDPERFDRIFKTLQTLQ